MEGNRIETLDKFVTEDEMIYAFSPITMVSLGGYLAVSHFQNPSTTEDIDVIIDPELQLAMVKVGRDLGFGEKWMNDSVALFVSKSACESIFEDAEKQNIILWSGENIRILAAPLEWGLETKLRRLSTKPHHLKAITDVEDVLVILNTLIDQNEGPLERDTIRKLNRNGFDVAIAHSVLDRVAKTYQERYGNNPFF
ncbi:predicted protein [Histoplasma mississippiense (nom. inval.)]|uniref:predicted protein n=1 Tax=Ajellomyces capsulatus (strain NAm1 / WU24) TaxID=2059318 RepID=UPI000157C339|nr:predicted protein [Histoplasma mississippiense (nom. inval.)]EDN07250.1 predicted protein [Histoplasma mississippiense (nom. inval.)]